MAKIYRTTDKIKYKINDLEIKLSPLSFDQKTELSQLMIEGQKDVSKAMEGTIKTIQYALKDIKGLEYDDGESFELEFDQGILTRESAEMLLNIDQSDTMVSLCVSFIGGVPKDLPEGVKLIPNQKAPKKK